MASPQQLNVKLDESTPYLFDCSFTEDDPDETPIDISSWTFNFKLTNSSDVVVWDVVNASFSRPSTGRITFEKSQAQVSALPEGLYTMKFLVSKSGVVDDEYLNGYYQR